MDMSRQSEIIARVELAAYVGIESPLYPIIMAQIKHLIATDVGEVLIFKL